MSAGAQLLEAAAVRAELVDVEQRARLAPFEEASHLQQVARELAARYRELTQTATVSA